MQERPRRMSKLLESGLCLLLLVGAAAALVFPALSAGRIPISTDTALFLAPWEDARPLGLNAPGDPQAADHANRFYPWYAFIADAAARGDSVLWNPLENGGFPFLAVWQTRALSPFSAPFYLLPVKFALPISLFLKLLIAGLCAYYAARRFGYLRPYALAIGLAYEFSGSLLLWWGWPLSDTAPWAPLLLLYAERLALRQRRFWPYGSLILGVMLLGGEPEAVAGAGAFVVFYLLARFVTERSGFKDAFYGYITLAGSGAVAVGLTALQIWPYREFLREAVQTTQTQGTSFLSMWDLSLAFFPHLLGGTTGPAAVEGALRNARVLELLYAGLAPLFLLPLWFALRRFVVPLQRQRVESLLTAAILSFALAMLAANVFPQVEMLQWVRPEHLFLLNALALMLVGASAAEEWITLDPDATHAAVLRYLILLPVLVLLALILALGRYLTLRASMPGVGGEVSDWLMPLGLLVAFLLTLGLTLLRPSHRLMGYSLAALMLLDLWTSLSGAISFTPLDRVFPETPFVRALKASGARVGGSEALKSWPLAANLVPQAFGTGGVSAKRYAAFVAQTAEKPMLLRNMGAPSFLLTKEDIQGRFADLRSRLHVQDVFPSGAVLFDALGSRPRAWMAYEGRPFEKFDPKQLDPAQPPLVEIAEPPKSESGGEAQVTIDPASTNTRVIVHVGETRPGVLVLADAWYPGWHARVGDAEAPMFPVDGAFRGVALQKGAHKVEFLYEPASFKRGCFWSLVAACLVFLGVVHHGVLTLRDRRLRAHEKRG